MGTIASQQIIFEPGRTWPAQRNGRARGGGHVKGERSTGLFPVPTGVGNPITATIFLSNPSFEQESAGLRVRRVSEGALVTIFYRVATVPAGEVRRIDLTDLAGQVIEVSLSPANSPLLPSVSVWEYFPADGGIIVRAAKFPGEFVEV